jgi:hypothetical protein
LNDVSLHQFLVLYTWFPLSALLFFLLLIARFYQRFSGVRTYYWAYVLVVVLFGLMAVRDAGAGLVLGDLLTDAFSILGGGILLFLTILLQLHMTRQRNND